MGISAPTLDESKSYQAAYADTMRFMESSTDPSLPSPAKKMAEIAVMEPTRHWNVTTRMTTRADHPRVLLHHVPLWRPKGETCEGERTRNKFLSHRSGYSYINVLPQDISRVITGLFKPLISLSGDDHDQCKMKHGTFFEVCFCTSPRWRNATLTRHSTQLGPSVGCRAIRTPAMPCCLLILEFGPTLTAETL